MPQAMSLERGVGGDSLYTIHGRGGKEVAIIQGEFTMDG